VIDGFETTAETATAHYMAWMGRLPMLLHARPRTALVICFGTGQTAAAVKDEGAPSLDVVELDPAVLSLAPLFRTNRGVLEQPGVEAHVMDGRAWLRRTERRYDVVSLEPMSPEFAGTNALYSVEFYRHMTRVLNRGAIVAQWVPFHIVPPAAAVAIVAAFTTVFPDALLWIDPRDRTGIVVGRQRGAATPLGSEWPGLLRAAAYRDLAPPEIRSAVWLLPAAVARYAALGPPVDDDNQALAYGRLPYHRLRLGRRLVEANLALIRQAAGGDPRRHRE
jgi:spermidine synthase